mgnify:CR=1 FL=1
MAQVIPLRSAQKLENEGFPSTFRLLSMYSKKIGECCFQTIASIFHAPSAITVHWSGPQLPKIMIGSLVKIEWGDWPINDDGSLTIGQLVPICIPERVNLFLTVPCAWVADENLLNRGELLWGRLSADFQFLFNAIFWDPRRFENYLTGPSSRSHHHNRRHGNLEHCLEVAKIALALADNTDLIDESVLVLAALLHDAAKGDEYWIKKDGQHQGWSTEGSLIGHRLMVYGWIECALASHPSNITQLQKIALKHSIIASEGIASWSGFPEPRMLEAKIISAADRVSGTIDLFQQLAPDNGGIGLTHRHVKLPFYYSTQKPPKRLD